jgi:hypothetical protein
MGAEQNFFPRAALSADCLSQIYRAKRLIRRRTKTDNVSLGLDRPIIP